jgi:hypothetical protein
MRRPPASLVEPTAGVLHFATVVAISGSTASFAFTIFIGLVPENSCILAFCREKKMFVPRFSPDKGKNRSFFIFPLFLSRWHAYCLIKEVEEPKTSVDATL